ncbi:uncharacterized protein LOC143027821 [Oratosquilla oratoria]|uniref:uncharacterized protein LOC143027821 n=1 Tax=Oratosquilla oratoria TaxID=337810 RepID=UPI003F766E30
MANLGQLIANSLWFAFDALDFQKTGLVPKSQLKVLTHNLGVLLGLTRRVEECIQDHHSTKHLSFTHYHYFLTKEVLAEVDDGSTPYEQLKPYHDALDDTFWLLARRAFLERDVPVFSEEAVFRLFRVFCLLADKYEDKKVLTQVCLTVGEVGEVTRRLVEALGREWDEQDFDNLASLIPSFSFPVFLTFLEGRYAQDIETPALEDAVSDVFDFFVEQVMRRGKLYQRLSWAPLWVCREVEVVPWALRMRSRGGGGLARAGVRASMRILAGVRGQVGLRSSSTVHSIPDSGGARPCRFTLCTSEDKLLQFAANDHKSKSQWLHALDTAIQNTQEALPFQMLLSAERKAERAEEEARATAEKIRRASQADIIEQTQAELVAEKIARAEAEAAAREEAAARATEERRVKELQGLREQLETLLEEETQAKRDEEIVRSLQARVLAEEWERREELERLQQEQRGLLEEETRKRKAFEKIQEEKEKQLREAEARLRALEKDRLKLDRELRSAREKIVMSERGKELLEAKMKVKERTPPVRTFSLRPARREKNATPTRSSSFNAHAAARFLRFRSRHDEPDHSDNNGNSDSNGNGNVETS